MEVDKTYGFICHGCGRKLKLERSVVLYPVLTATE